MLQQNKTLKIIITLASSFFIVWFLLYFLLGENFSYTFSNPNLRLAFPKWVVFMAAVSAYLLVIIQINIKKKWHFSNVIKFIVAIFLGTIPFLLYGVFSVTACPFWMKKSESVKTLYTSKLNQEQVIILQKNICLDTQENRTDTVKVTPFLGFLESTTPISKQEIEPRYWQEIK